MDARRSALACTTLAEALKEPTFCQLIKHTSMVDVVAEIVVVIEKGMEGFAPGRKLSPAHIVDWAQKLARNWQHESLADLALFLQNPSKYDGGEFYATVDVPRISKWWEAFLLEKADALEQVHAAKKAEPDPWDALAEELQALLATRGDREATTEEAEREGELRARMDDLDQRRFATADGWRKLRMALKADRAPVLNRSVADDRLRRALPTMTAEQLRDAWKKHPDAWSRRLILEQAQHRGLVEKYLERKLREEEPGKAEAARIIADGLTVPLPTQEP